MIVAKFVLELEKDTAYRVSYLPVLGWSDVYALVPGEEGTHDAGRLYKATDYPPYGQVEKFFFTGEEVAFDILNSRENNEKIIEYYLYSDTFLGDDKNGLLSE